MDTSEDGRFPLSITLDPDSYAFVERFMAAGVFASRNELFEAALGALAHAIEASARKAAAAEGYPESDEASLEELADVLDRSSRRREN